MDDRARSCSSMTEEDMRFVVRALNDAIMKMDVQKLLSFYAEDATLIAPEGTFKGKEEIMRYWTWQFGLASGIKTTETGFGMIVQGNKLAAEHIVDIIMLNGMKPSVLIACLYEFSRGEIRLHKMSSDRLALSKQAAKGWFATTIVNMLVSQMEKGLR